MTTIQHESRPVSRRSQSGVAAVEFALILPVLLLIVFGIINFGLYLYDKAVVTNASREGARAGIVSVVSGNGFGTPPGCTAQTSVTSGVNTAQCVATSYVQGNLVTFDTPTLTVTATESGGGCATSPLPVGSNTCKLSVTVNYAFSSIGFFDFVFPTISATTVMYY